VPVVEENLQTALVAMREHGLRVVATSSHKGTPVAKADLAQPVAILIGNEGAGLPRHTLSDMDELIAIPHSPRVESLNAGVAASIILYEAARQRAEASED
jgi:tRNA G18 (ribose-2'-O)-methylase SpoU